MTGVLGWQPGDRLTLTATAGAVIARRDPGGMVAMLAKPYLMIPAALRRRCGLRPGDRVLLAVFPARDALAAYSFAVVDQASPKGTGSCSTPDTEGRSADRSRSMAFLADN